ncbi:MAG TPA: hypothetical protein DCO75_01235 [Fibrobacteres bacterium]|nr:hypothetical protein [Fibrobacterota bacterium]
MAEKKLSVINMLENVSCSARIGDYAEAALSFNHCTIELNKIIQTLVSDQQKQNHLKKITYSLQTLLLMLKNEDWVAIADIIDYELIPLLDNAFKSNDI